MNFKKLLSYVFSAYTLGFVITLVAFQYSMNYYLNTHSSVLDSDAALIYRALDDFHKKTIDMRLEFRGPRPGSDDIAVLAIDERSIDAIGRWPWPREKMSHILDEANRYGAKVLAFDIGYPEESNSETLKLLSQLRDNPSLNSELKQTLENNIRAADSDQLFAEGLKRNNEKVVMGSFFLEEQNLTRSLDAGEICLGFIFHIQPEYQYWTEKQEVLVASADIFNLYIPEPIARAYQQYLKSIAEAYQSEAGQKALSKVEKADLNIRILNEQMNFCGDAFWIKGKDPVYDALEEAWPQILAADEDLKSTTYAEWVETQKERFLANPVIWADGWSINVEKIANQTRHTGFFNANLDSDGSIRKAKLLVRTGDVYMPSISLKAFLVAHNYNAEVHFKNDQINPERKMVSVLKITNNEDGNEVFTIPVDGRALLPINYAGPQEMFPYFSAANFFTPGEDAKVRQRVYNKETGRWEIAERTVKKADFIKNKIFVIGATAVGVYDLRVTPFDENYPGVETHANVIDNLIRRDFLMLHPMESKYMPFALLLLGILHTVVVARIRALSGLLLSFFTLAAIIYIDRYFIFGKGYVIVVIFPIVLILAIDFALTFFKYFTEERKKRELKGTFAKYVSPAIVDEILSDPAKIELGGRKERMSVFFSDVRGFTTIAEKLDPRALSDLLNSYLTPMTQIVFKNKGTLDKYMGDAIMAFWGAPIPYKEHAIDACRTALQSIEKLKELQAEYKRLGYPEIDIGIGINTGDMSVGNMGSDIVRSYTVMGDAVNLASRLEGINKTYGTRIVISEFTFEEVKDRFVCREIDRVRVKGKALPVKIYELIVEGKVPAEIAQHLQNFSEGYELYHQKKWPEALAKFEQALSQNPNDPVAKLYIERCSEYMQDPPGEDWDGVYVMKTK